MEIPRNIEKVHLEHNEASNKDIINIENNLQNIDKKLAKQAYKINEQMKSIKKTDSSVKVLWGIVDGLTNNGSPWFIIGKNGKAHKPSEPIKKTQEAKKNEQFQLLIFEVSITKNISPSAIAKYDEMQAVNCSTDGSKVGGIYE